MSKKGGLILGKAAIVRQSQRKKKKKNAAGPKWRSS